MPIKSPLDYLPGILPTQDIRTTESHTFTVIEHDGGTTSTEYVYDLDKSPIDRVDEVVGSFNGRDYTFAKGTDYAVIDDNGDGRPDSIDFSIGGVDPDPNTTFEVTYVAQSILNRYVSAHHETVEPLNGDIEDTIQSHQVENATGDHLDKIGALFGEIGKRRGRSDEEYRALLKSIAQSFSGRGTKPGMKFAIAAGIGADPSEITIQEDFDQVGYTIRIDTDAAFRGSVVNDMAEIADPSGVELLEPPAIILDGESVISTETDSQVTNPQIGLGGGTLSIDGSSTLGRSKTHAIASTITGTGSLIITDSSKTESGSTSPVTATNL